MDEFLNREYYGPMRLYHICYLPLRTHKKDEVVPTVKNDCFRGELIQGFVNDEAAAYLGGISGNAGLLLLQRMLQRYIRCCLMEVK